MPEQPDTAPPPAPPAVGRAAAPGRAHVLDVLAEIRSRSGSVVGAPEPDRILAGPGVDEHLVELLFESGPRPVLAWASALGFDPPRNWVDEQLGTAIIQAEGAIRGWRVAVRHASRPGSPLPGQA